MAAEVVIDVRAEDNTSGVLGNIATAGFAVLTAAVAAMGATLYSSVQSAMESQNAIADLEATLKSTDNAAGMTSQQLQDMATNLQNVTKFSDETIISGEAMLLTFTNIGADVFPQATEAMLNLAEKFGSVETASVQLGKALNDPIAGVTALRRVGVQLSDDQENQIKQFMAVNDIASAQGVILAELEKEFGGLAVAAGQTFAGQLEIAKSKLDNFKELLGGPIIAGLTELLRIFNEFDIQADFSWAGVAVSMLQRMNELLDKGAPFWYSLGITFVNFSSFLPIFQDIGKAFMDMQNALDQGMGPLEAFQNLLNSLGTTLDTSNLFGNLSQAFYDWTASIDWKRISDDLAIKINSIDWNPVGHQITKVLTNVFNGIGVIVENVDWSPVGNALVGAFSEIVAGLFGESSVEQWGVDIREGLLVALGGLGEFLFKAITGTFDWQVAARDWASSIANGLITGFKNLLGIASPSTVFMEFGKNIVQGLIAGWDATVGALFTAIGTTIVDIGNLFGIDLSSILGGSSASGLGTAGGGVGTTGGGTGGGSTGGGTVINIYGTSYWGVSGPGDVGGVYDCPSPNALVASSANQLVVSGF